MYGSKPFEGVYGYVLRDAWSIVYIGITNNPERRCDDHWYDEGKFFVTLDVIKGWMPRWYGELWETSALIWYRWRYGDYPLYNRLVPSIRFPD